MNGVEYDDPEDEHDFEEGRYLYCVVEASEGATLTVEGIDGTPVSVLAEGGVGAVLQPVDSVYDSEDMTQVRHWLLTHQQVVETAGSAFGTPIPFRFDTIFKGDDETVSVWLRDNHQELSEGLDWLAGCWEYRIEVRWNEQHMRETLREEDPRLGELARRIEEAESGTSYLLESKFEQRLTDRLQQRSEELEARLVEGIRPYTVDFQVSTTTARVLPEDDESSLDTAVQLSVLADSDHEERIGKQLELIADQPQYEVRYTGPWPPYSHAPEIGGGEP